MNWSPYQEAIFTALQTSPVPIAVKSVAGSGKTTTLVEAAKRAQLGYTLFCAFNKHIADHMGTLLRYEPDVRVLTIHSLAFGALRVACVTRLRVDEYKYTNLARRLLDDTPALWRDAGFDSAWDAAPSLRKLFDFTRLTALDPRDADGFAQQAESYGLTAPPIWIERLPSWLKQAAQQAEDNGLLDFTDMLYLPTRWDLPLPKFDAVMLDESQDLNAAQLAIVLRTRRPDARGLLVGDPSQSVFSFAFAMSDSFDIATAAFGASVLPLSICYRCPTSHLDLARRFVPYIEPRPDAPVGEVVHTNRTELSTLLQPNDMILCRTTAPLIAYCLDLLRARVPARVRGRDIGSDLAATIKATRCRQISSFESDLLTYEQDTLAKLYRQHAPAGQHAALRDRIAGVRAAYEGIAPESVEHFVSQVHTIFADNGVGSGAVLLSTIHRAKGLEANRVFLLQPDKLGEVGEEANVHYVALTRAKQTLGFVEE